MEKPEKITKAKEGKLHDPHPIERAREYLLERYKFRQNDISGMFEYKELLTAEPWKILEQRQQNTIFLQALIDGVKLTKARFSEIIDSEFTPRYNPITEFFTSLKWDGNDHIRKLAQTVKIADDNSEEAKLMVMHWPLFLRRWLVGVAACAVAPDIRNDFCLILAGGQGVGKTTWIDNLTPPDLAEYSHTGHITPNLSDYNTVSYLTEKFLINIDDQLDGIFAKDFQAIKGIISATYTTIRKLYNPNHKKRPRIASFCGSVNTTDFLRDEENRRYLCFIVERIQRNPKIDIKQVWAQAYTLFKRGEPYYFSASESQAHRRINEIFSRTSVEQEWLTKIFLPAIPSDIGVEYLQKSEILSILSDRSRLRNLNIRELSAALRRCGFGDPISKRVDRLKSPRYVIPVIYRDQSEDSPPPTLN